MIQLHSDYLMFQMPDGGAVPCSAELVTVELVGEAAMLLDPELIRHAASAVLHYFKFELGRSLVSVGEFSQALGRVLRGFGLHVTTPDTTGPVPLVESDLRQLACESGKGFELAFFPRLRAELRRQVMQSPRVLRFTGLRGCVKQLMGARRWSARCQQLNDQIVVYLRQCLGDEERSTVSAMVVQ